MGDTQFDKLSAVLSVKLINLPAEEIDNEINESLKQICEYLDLDVSVLWQLKRSDNKDVFVTNYFQRNILAEIPELIEAKKLFPWTLEKILKKEIVRYKNVDELPPEAEIDKQTRLHFNLKSLLSYPLFVSKNPVFGALSFNTIRKEVNWTDELIDKLQFIANIFSNAISRKITENKLKESLAFERLISVLSSRFVNVNDNNLYEEINSSLKQICEFLDFDVSTLWMINKESPDESLLLSYYRRSEGPEVPQILEASKTFPWSLKKILEKKEVLLKNSSDYPPEAVIDKENRDYFNLKSTLTLPLYIGNSPVFGIISYDTIDDEIEWTEEKINKLKYISQIFANAISRRISEQAIQESEERLRLAASSAGAGFWNLIFEGGKIWATKAAERLYDVADMENYDFETIKKKIYPEDLERGLQDIDEAIKTGNYNSKIRILNSDGTIRWLSAQGKIEYNFEKNPERMVGVSIDITKEKENERLIKESEELQSSIINSSNSRIMVLDENFKILNLNKAWKEFSEKHSDEKSVFNLRAGMNLLLIFEKISKNGSDFASKHLKGIKSVLSGKLKIYENTYKLNTNDEEFWFSLTVTPLIGQKKGVVLIHRNETSLMNAQIALENALEDVKKLKNQLQQDNIYLKEEIKLKTKYDNILGKSDAIKYCLFNVEKVAPLNTTVLIYGETGTGKELIARAIHNASSRQSRPLIKVDCSTLPQNIIESELFGREKGAYTDASTRSTGRFELANGSTLFLDEIGELPLHVQSKLLRMTQYGEFERLGSSKTIKVDVRLIAATNRDLEEEVKNGRFREDLFFRLNVFKITVPPLRERKEDIPEMVIQFIKNINRKLGKNIEFVYQETLDMLLEYSWPGNVRELENVLESSIITSRGSKLVVNLPNKSQKEEKKDNFRLIPLSEIEKEYIIEILKRTNWKIEGVNSASAILEVAPSTLRDRMKKYNIKRK